MGSTSSASPACATAPLEKLLTASGIIRNRLKVYSVRDNARVALDVIGEHGSLDAYLWSFVDGKPHGEPLAGTQAGAGERPSCPTG